MSSLRVMLSLMFIVSVSGSVFAVLSGTGSELDPYLIQNQADFDLWRSNTSYRASGIYTKLMTDLDLGGVSYNGQLVSGTFEGDFNGNGYKILNFSITNGHGVFFYLAGSIRNLSIINCTVNSTSVVAGGLCKQIQASGVVSNCYFSGSVSSTQHYVGGIAGWNSGTISKCAVDADVVGGTDGTLYASTGVFVGGNYGWISDCYANGSATAIGWLGGFTGFMDTGGTINNCYSTAQVIIVGSSGGQIDGFVGRPLGTIQNCFIDETRSATTSGNAGVTGLSSADMQVESNFTDAEWDFADIWTMGATAPILKWQADGTYCLTPPFFDYTNDCLVTLADFAAFAASWLSCGYANQALCP